MNDETYNGWTNYETWLIKVELLDFIEEAILNEFIEADTKKRAILKNQKRLIEKIKERAEEYIETNGYKNRIDRHIQRWVQILLVDKIDWGELAESVQESFEHHEKEENE